MLFMDLLAGTCMLELWRRVTLRQSVVSLSLHLQERSSSYISRGRELTFFNHRLILGSSRVRMREWLARFALGSIQAYYIHMCLTCVMRRVCDTRRFLRYCICNRYLPVSQIASRSADPIVDRCGLAVASRPGSGVAGEATRCIVESFIQNQWLLTSNRRKRSAVRCVDLVGNI